MLGVAGVLLIVAGVYVLHIDRQDTSWKAPLKALWAHPGARLMLGVNLVWSVVANVDAIGTRMTDPWSWAVLSRGGIFLWMSLLVMIRPASRRQVKRLGRHTRIVVALLLCWATAAVAQMAAMDLTLVSYVIAVKRTSAIMSVIWGAWLFKEKGLRERLAGTSIAVLGVVLISLG